jgi:hypothetical protein
MTRGPGPLQRWILSWLREAVDREGTSEWISVSDLTKLRLSRDDPPSRLDLDGTRKAVARLEAQGLVQVAQQPRLIQRTVVPAAGTGKPVTVEESRDVVCCRLTPTIEQQMQDAEAEVARCEAVVAERPGWEYARQQLQRARKEADRLAAQMAGAT